MNNYETVFILTPDLSEAQVKEAVAKFVGILKGEGAEIVNEENWGLKKLAYQIQKKTTGYYQLVEFQAQQREEAARHNPLTKGENKNGCIRSTLPHSPDRR